MGARSAFWWDWIAIPPSEGCFGHWEQEIFQGTRGQGARRIFLVSTYGPEFANLIVTFEKISLLLPDDLLM